MAAGEMASTGKYLPNIQDRVRQCVTLPYVYQADGIRRDQTLISHCPEVKVLPVVNHVKSAKIRVAGHQFVATLVETEFTDGDFYDVEIRDLQSNDAYRLYNVAAYGDVLLGVLNGNTKGVVDLQLK